MDDPEVHFDGQLYNPWISAASQIFFSHLLYRQVIIIIINILLDIRILDIRILGGSSKNTSSIQVLKVRTSCITCNHLDYFH